MNDPTNPEPIGIVSFEVLVHTEEKTLIIIVSGETASSAQEAVVLGASFDVAHRLVGRLLGGLVALDRDNTLAALRQVLKANAQVPS